MARLQYYEEEVGASRKRLWERDEAECDPRRYACLSDLGVCRLCCQVETSYGGRVVETGTPDTSRLSRFLTGGPLFVGGVLWICLNRMRDCSSS